MTTLMYFKGKGGMISTCFLLITALSYIDAVTLNGSSEWAALGSEFTLMCDVPDEANAVRFYRRPEVSTPVGSIQVAGDQCYNIKSTPVFCTPDVCSCVTTSTGGRGTVFRLVIQPQTRDHRSVWFCSRINLNLTDQIKQSPDFTLQIAEVPGRSISLYPTFTSYIRKEGYLLTNITCRAECRPDCTFVWTKPDNTNFTASAVLSLGQLDRSEHGIYRCTARNDIGESSTTVNITVLSMPRTPKIFGITKVSSSSLTLKWTPNDQDNSANTFTITYSCVDCDVIDVMSVDVGGTRDTQFTILTDLRSNTQYYINVTASSTAGSSVSAELTAVTAPGIIDVCTASQDTVGPTSTAVIVVSAILIVAAVVCFGISVFVYRKARVLNRAAGQQEIVQKPVKFSDVLNPDTIPAHAEERSHYQDLDPKDIGKPSLYEGTTTAEINKAERGHYQELDLKDVGMQSSYGITARVNTDVDSDAARDQYESGQSTRHDYKNVTGKRDTKSTALYSNT